MALYTFMSVESAIPYLSIQAIAYCGIIESAIAYLSIQAIAFGNTECDRLYD
ncbi:hypothetical protein GNE08_21315 [Trichormus variabilis ARAD]|uniref:Uncharacterized protein n=1 Tax=Trichormus variabilis N2B TaxID=2681315 RepID=A0ABR6SF10_ANAVA|nr:MULTISPECIES: hypothetical protein [Nostocaceae]MBC1216750.1 hypothetical protein [Trichormus variabilis ARAD]MBC1258622.1 hypothetical protein [Trichormus variabilis V5]MBC1269361.1 hypothetical protein [Trichormus variabilis FSR]MBC1304994.1 hypothetical protein [Trichormus variabilis N2B]MBC1313777.1 hypothetical protein [Trichormus variabilis PNB]